MIEQKATLRYLRIAPRKARSVGDLVKGLSVNDAEAQLLIQRRRPAKAILKLLRSAVANAKTNQKLDAEKLFVRNVQVEGGPMLKRILPRARGSASPIEKKMSHVTITLGVNENLKSKFTIVVPKKTKLPPVSDTKKIKDKRNPKENEGQNPETKKPKPSFWKRTFNRRKAGGE
ncbi:MAG TPA: 50S ribosomal protein L22 [Candidatus Paceibacterota bacterium]|nr:50S ribosomal protein L22 [Candidatus Paceibacterota bacterium]